MLARALALALFAAAAASAEVPVPALSARVTDLTGTLDAGERSALEAKLAAFERAKGSQVVVLIVPTTQPETIEQYSIRVADAWKIGRKDIDDGVLLIVAKDDRAVRIEVRYGLEGALPDAIAKRIIEEAIIPRFRAGDFHGGISGGVDRILSVIEGEPLPAPIPRDFGGLPVHVPLWAIVPPLLIGGLIRLAHNRGTGALAAGGLSWALGAWSAGASIELLFVALFCAALVFGQGRGGHRGWASGGWSGGGSSGGGFGGGFGGGGFSGGGGRGGGGGASGHW